MKIRAYHIKKKEWLTQKSEEILDIFLHWMGNVATIETDENVVIQQYICIKDKNGIEIYEGDRVKLLNSGEIGTIEFGNCTVTADDNYCGGNSIGFHIKFDETGYTEAIGNKEYSWGESPIIPSNLLIVGNIFDTQKEHR